MPEVIARDKSSQNPSLHETLFSRRPIRPPEEGACRDPVTRYAEAPGTMLHAMATIAPRKTLHIHGEPGEPPSAPAAKGNIGHLERVGQVNALTLRALPIGQDAVGDPTLAQGS